MFLPLIYPDHTSIDYRDSSQAWYKTFPESNPIYGCKHYSWMDERGVYFPDNISGPNTGQYVYDIDHPITKRKVKMPSRGWFCPKEKLISLVDQDLVHFGKDETTVPCLKTYLKNTQYKNLTSIVFKDGRAASKRLRSLFNDNIFTNPKDEDVLCRLMNAIGVDDGDIVLDFFAGSGTTAHAVFNYNLEKEIKSRFILVQLPEKLEELQKTATGLSKKIISNAIKYLNSINKDLLVTEICKERIKKAGEKIIEENKDNSGVDNLDIGFKVFRVGETNINWLHQELKGGDLFDHYDQNATDKDRLDFTPGFTDLDVVYEVMLRQTDIPLSSKVEQLADIGDRTYIFADSFLVCLEQTITQELVDRLAALEPLPIKFIFRDSAFNDDIALKDETFRRLSALIDRNNAGDEQTYTVEFI